MTVKIIVDSASCLSKEVANRHGIVVLDLQVNTDATEKAGFGVGTTTTTTSALGPLELCAAYSRQLALGNDDGVVALHVSKTLSSTWSNGVTAAEVLGERVQVVDTQSVGMGIGFAAVAAAQCAERGGTVTECVAAAKEVLHRSSMWAYVPHMEYLRRGGRLTTGATIISTALAMKPVITLRDGKLELAAKTRTETKALSRLVELVVAEAGGEPVDVAIQYAGARRDAAELAKVLTRFLGEHASVQLAEVSPAVEVHSGPDSLVVSVARKQAAGDLAADDMDLSQPSLFDGLDVFAGRSDQANDTDAKVEAAGSIGGVDTGGTKSQTWSSWRETLRQATEKASGLAAEIAAELSSERAKRDADARAAAEASAAVDSSADAEKAEDEVGDEPEPGSADK